MAATKKVIVCIVGIMLVVLLTGSENLAKEIKIALDCPPDLDKCGTYVWSDAFGNHLRSKGMQVKEYSTEALGGEDEKLDQVSQGLLEVSNSMLMKVGQVDPIINAFWLAFLWESYEHLDRALAKSDLLQRVNDKLTKKGIRLLALVPVGGFVGIANNKKPIYVPEDLKGLRMRATDKVQSKYLEAWGASSVIVPWPEIYNALQTGVAEGYLNPSIVPVLFKHTEVLKYFADVGVSASLRVSIASEDWYSGLSAEERAIVDEAVIKGDEANRAWLARTMHQANDALRAAGMEITEPSSEQKARFAALVRPLYPEVVPADVAKYFVGVAEKHR